MNRPPERLKNMKLPTATSPANFQEMKQKSVKPLKRLSGHLIKNVRQSISTKLVGKNPFRALPSPSAVKDSKGSKVLLNLLLVRPWVLVLGFWLLSMTTGTLALNGMLSPRKLKMALPEPALDSGASSQANALLNVNQAEGGGEQSKTAPANETAAGNVPVVEVGTQGADTAEGGLGLPVLPIVSLVGACAAGSLIISRRRAMVRMAAARAQGRKRRSRPVTASASARTADNTAKENLSSVRKGTLASSSERPKKKRQRARKSAVTARPAGSGSRVLASRTTAQQQKAAQPRRVQKNSQKVEQRAASAVRSSARPTTRVSRTQARRAAARAASRRQPMVSVVPANESHALDWTNGSLAHQLDVRQHRSAM